MLNCLRCRKVLMMSSLFQLSFRKRSGEVTTLGCGSVLKRQGRAHDLHTYFFDLIYLVFVHVYLCCLGQPHPSSLSP